MQEPGSLYKVFWQVLGKLCAAIATLLKMITFMLQNCFKTHNACNFHVQIQQVVSDSYLRLG